MDVVLCAYTCHCRHKHRIVVIRQEEEAEEHQSNIISSHHVSHRQRCILFFSIAQEEQQRGHVGANKWVEKGRTRDIRIGIILLLHRMRDSLLLLLDTHSSQQHKKGNDVISQTIPSIFQAPLDEFNL